MDSTAHDRAASPLRSRGASGGVMPAAFAVDGPAMAVSLGDNLFLAHLPEPVSLRLKPHLERVHLKRRQVLFHPHEPIDAVYFPTTALISFVAGVESGHTLEVGLVGRDGFAGIAVFPWAATMACDGMVQIAGSADRLSVDVLRQEMQQSEALLMALGRYSQALHVRCMQMSVCNMFHSVEQRCVRWLLSVQDLIGDPAIPLTHDLIATMLGVRRPTVTLVLRALHQAALIDEQRGRIVIRDRARLEAASCECYRVMREEQRRLLGY
jgi:CRP-like cAMP-binding protein